MALCAIGRRCSAVGACTRMSQSLVQSLCRANFSNASEFTEPVMKTAVPGPRSKELLAELNEIQQTGTVAFFVDYERSKGNFVVDADSNVLLDTFAQISSLPLGYNHPAVLAALSKPSNLATLASRPALGVFPSVDYAQLLENSLLSVAPAGHSEVTTMMCGTCSNENCFKSAFIQYMDKHRESPLSPDSPEFETALINKPPGSPNLSVLSFMGAFHGRALATLSCTHSKPIHKLDIPAFDWPIAPFPRLRYPLEEFTRENQAEERSCLEQTEDLMASARKNGVPVAAVIIEPIQAEGGDNHASHEFFRELQQICKRQGAFLIVDEVQTGCGATGYMWAHEAWDLPESPDYVTFAKKMLIGGYYNRKGVRPKEAYRIFNTWMGDPVRLVLLEAVLGEIKQRNLIQNVRETGEVLLAGLKELQARYPSLLHSARGAGTFCAVDCPDAATRDKLIGKLRNKGFQTGGTGNTAIRFRPSLIFQPKHAHMFLDGFEAVLKEVTES